MPDAGSGKRNRVTGSRRPHGDGPRPPTGGGRATEREWPIGPSGTAAWPHPDPADSGLPSRAAVFAALVRDGRHDEALDRAMRAVIEAAGADRALLAELGSLRLLLRRVMAVDGLEGEIHATSLTVARLVEQITAIVRAQRKLSGTAGDDLAAAVDAILADLGVGEE